MPSEVIGVTDKLAAWMINDAVTWFGITIENALQERIEYTVGSKTESKPRYTLVRLLNSATKLPRSIEDYGSVNPLAPLMAWGKRGGRGVKYYYYVPPEDGAQEDVSQE